VNEVVDKREAVSRCEILQLAADVGVPSEKGGLVKRTLRGYQSKMFTPVRGSYPPALEFRGEDDDYGSERSRWLSGAKMAPSGKLGHRKRNLLFGR